MRIRNRLLALVACLWIPAVALAQSPPDGRAAKPADRAAVGQEPNALRYTRAGTKVERRTTAAGRQVVEIARAHPRGSVLQTQPKNWLGYRYWGAYYARYGHAPYVTPLRPPYYTSGGQRIYERYSSFGYPSSHAYPYYRSFPSYGYGGHHRSSHLPSYYVPSYYVPSYYSYRSYRTYSCYQPFHGVGGHRRFCY